MSELDVPLRRANYLVWRAPLLKRRVRLKADKLTVYSSRIGFIKESFVVKPSWRFRVVRERGLAIRDGEYFRLTLFFKTIEDRTAMEVGLKELCMHDSTK